MATSLFNLLLLLICIWLVYDDFYGGFRLVRIAASVTEGAPEIKLW
jgi:hypothetical protein